MQSKNKKTPAPWKESFDKLRQRIKKQRHHLLTKVRIVKAMVFPLAMYRCESWTYRRLRTKELMLLNCGAEEYSSKSVGQ